MAQRYSKHNIDSLFLKLLPAQIFSNLTASLSGIVNGILVGKYLTSVDMIALGFATPITMINSVVSTIIASGARIVCGQYIGRGEKRKINETFSISIISLLFVGALMSAIGLGLAVPIVKAVGASASSISKAAAYIRGISIGIIPTIISPCLMVFLQMENDSNYALVSTVVLAVVNFILTSFALKAGMVGMFEIGLLTSVSQYIVFAMLAVRFIFKKNLPRLSKTKNYKLLKEITIIGLPNALANFLYTSRNSVLNRYALSIYGEPAVQALSILNSSCGPFDAFNIGVGSTLLMLLSIYIGEKDREAIKQVIKTSMVYGLIIAFIKVLIIVLGVDKLSMLYGADGETALLTRNLYIHYGLTMPINIITVALTNAYQALKRIKFVNIILIFNAFVTPLGYVLLAKNIIGIDAVWSCYWVAEIVSITAMYIAACLHKKGFVHGIGDMMHIEDSVKVETSKVVTIKRIEEVVNVARDIQLFCEENNISKSKSMIAGLCCEEMAGNIIEHGFSKCKNKRNKVIDIYVGINEDKINIRIKDNAVAFDPHIKLQNNDDPTSNIGIKMVSKLAKHMNYQNTFGLNVLAIEL